MENILEGNFQNTIDFFIDESRDMFPNKSVGETVNSWIGDTLEIIMKHLMMMLFLLCYGQTCWSIKKFWQRIYFLKYSFSPNDGFQPMVMKVNYQLYKITLHQKYCFSLCFDWSIIMILNKSKNTLSFYSVLLYIGPQLRLATSTFLEFSKPYCISDSYEIQFILFREPVH